MSEALDDAYIELSHMGLHVKEIASLRRSDIMDGDKIRNKLTVVRETWRDASGLVRISTTHATLSDGAKKNLLALVRELDATSSEEDPYLFDTCCMDE